jgi:DNA-binding transcriptional LysR family regulator
MLRPMDRLDRYRIFMQVAEMGSFIKAAHALDLPRATVSAAVQQLEEQVARDSCTAPRARSA